MRWSHCWRLSIPAKWTGQVNALRCLTDFTRIWISLDICSRLSNTKWPPSGFVYECSIVGFLVCASTNQIASFKLRFLAGNVVMTSKRLDIAGNFWTSQHRNNIATKMWLLLTFHWRLPVHLQETIWSKCLRYLNYVKRARKILMISIYLTLHSVSVENQWKMRYFSQRYHIRKHLTQK